MGSAAEAAGGAAGAPDPRRAGPRLVHAGERNARGARPPSDPPCVRRGDGGRLRLPDDQLGRRGEPGRRAAPGSAADSHGARPGARPPRGPGARARARRDHAPDRADDPNRRDLRARGDHRSALRELVSRRGAAGGAWLGRRVRSPRGAGGGHGGARERRVHGGGDRLLHHHGSGARSRSRGAHPAALERVLLRALKSQPGDRYFTATEMLEDFVSDAGTFHEPAATPQVAEVGFERRLRRALGDDYELLDEIGSGGFGRVFRARDLGLEREVAIKVLHPSLTADLGVVERFRREAQLAAKLRHPNVVSIYDIMGRAGLQWYTMELVPGANLAQLVQREGPLTLERTVRLLDEALSALEQAHAQGLVHRDLKPENMLIEPDGRLRITDFGLALALRGDRFGGATSRSGTPQFAAPEQLLGERVDPRTDLYSLGAVAFYTLLGRPPFDGATPEAILARQTTDDLPPLHASRGDVPREFEEVLRRAMTGDPAARYPTAQQFRRAVRKSQGFLRRLVVFLRGD